MTRIVLILVGFFAMTGDAWAWGDTGHKIVCEIAMRLAAPNTRAEVQRLIKTDAEFDSSQTHVPGQITHGNGRRSTS
jgi:hypothetical protein